MSKDPLLYMVLGCFGETDDDFVKCVSIENGIYPLMEDHYYFTEIMAYLDNCKLFDKPLTDFNAIRNFLATFREKFEIPMKPIWTERKYQIYQRFLIDHRNCGLYLKLVLMNSSILDTDSTSNRKVKTNG